MDNYSAKDFYEMLATNMTYLEFKSWLCNETTIRNLQFRHYECLNGTDHALTLLKYAYDRSTNHASGDPGGAFLLTLTAFLFVVGVSFNLLLLKVTRRKQRDGHKLLYIRNIIVADIAVLVAMVIFIILVFKPLNFSAQFDAYFFPSVDMLLYSATMLSAMLIAVHRIVCITRFTGKLRRCIDYRQKKLVTAVWVYSFFIFGLSLSRIWLKLNEKLNRIFVCIPLFISIICCVLTFICHLVILFIYIRYVKNAYAMHCNVKAYIIRLNKRNQRKIIRVSLMTLTALIPYIFGWGFYLIVHIYELVENDILRNEHLNLAMIAVPWIVCATNPIAILVLNKSLRKELKRLIQKHKKMKESEKETLIFTLEPIKQKVNV